MAGNLEKREPDIGMAEEHPKRLRDLNRCAKRVTEIVSGEVEDREPTPEEQGKDPAAVERGRWQRGSRNASGK
jgi:hypothetical protein